jgi:hypothetical protein
VENCVSVCQRGNLSNSSREKGGGKLNPPELLAKLLKARESCHSGQAKRDPESSIFEQFWIPAFAGMTE